MNPLTDDKCLLSVIIPIYNVEKTLERAILSVLAQGISNYEILLVDDGSTDSSGAIADDYSQKYPFIKVFHKKNGGLSSARNFGIQNARGEIFAFLDSDDYFLPNIFQKGLVFFEQKDVDIVIFGLDKGNEDDVKRLSPKKNCIVDTGELITEMFKDKGFDFYAWNKFYRRELFKEIRYPEGKLYEDVVPTYEVMKRVNKAQLLDVVGIFYYQNKESIVYQKFNPKQYDNIDQRKILLSKILNDFPQLIGLAIDKLIDGYLTTGFKLTTKINEDKEKRIYLMKARREIRSNLKRFLWNKETTFYKKIALIILLINSYLYNTLYRLLLKK